MIIKKKLHESVTVVLMFIALCLFAACSKDGNDENGDNSSVNKEVENIIKANTYVRSTYSDYCWDINISTTLSDVYPDKNIMYGINCGYDDKYLFDKFAEGYGDNYTVKAELYMKENGTPFTSEGMYYTSYLALLPQYQSGNWTYYENREVFESLSSVLKNSEREAKDRYCCRVFVNLDGDYYYVKQINGTPSTEEYYGGNDGGNGGGNGGGNYTNESEAPQFFDVSYTYTETSIDIIFATEPKATKATIYYGTSSPTNSVPTTITGRSIKAHIGGLKKGTKYYVKCVASNNYGSTTSEIIPVRTDYYY